MHIRSLLPFLLGLLCYSTPGISQTVELGISGGGAGYMGDLNPNKPLKLSGISLGGFAKLNLDPYWALGIQYNYGKIKGNDAHSGNAQFRERNINFETPLNEISIQTDFNFFDYFSGGGFKNFSPYIFAGGGLVLFNPKAVYDGNKYTLRFYKTEGEKDPYRNYTISLIYGAGAKWRLNENWGFFSQIGYRTSGSDYLDDVSQRYPSPSRWPENDSAKLRALRAQLSDPSATKFGTPGVQRGDFRKEIHICL